MKDREKKVIIRLENVVKSYPDGQKDVKVLDGVSLSINEGEFAVLTGQSGTGKSTILNLIGGMESVTSGKIIVDGEEISEYSESKRSDYRAKKIGFVFQFYNLIPNLNSAENIALGNEVKNDTLDPLEMLEKVGLKDKADSFPSSLSGGEQQRVAIARAIAKKPAVLLCDEPTGALDFETSRTVLGVLEKMNKESGITVVMVTHNDVLSKMADRVIRVKRGLVESVYENTDRRSVSELEW